jgi:hypothetical protein
MQLPTYIVHVLAQSKTSINYTGLSNYFVSRSLLHSAPLLNHFGFFGSSVSLVVA